MLLFNFFSYKIHLMFFSGSVKNTSIAICILGLSPVVKPSAVEILFKSPWAFENCSSRIFSSQFSSWRSFSSVSHKILIVLPYSESLTNPWFTEIAEIGDIRRFRNADKLARYAGVAPIKFSSAGKGKEESSRQGNRQLHGLFYFLAVSMVTVPKSGKLNQPIFYAYFQRKTSEGKTKS